jgi:hypothetical protein
MDGHGAGLMVSTPGHSAACTVRTSARLPTTRQYRIAASGVQPHCLSDAHCHESLDVEGTSLSALALPSGSPRPPEALPLATLCVFHWLLVHSRCVRRAAAPVQWLTTADWSGISADRCALSRGSPQCTFTAIQHTPVRGSPHFSFPIPLRMSTALLQCTFAAWMHR